MALVERQFSRKMKTLRSDNGMEFTCLAQYFREHRVIHETFCVYTPQQNGRPNTSIGIFLISQEHCGFNQAYRSSFGESVF